MGNCILGKRDIIQQSEVTKVFMDKDTSQTIVYASSKSCHEMFAKKNTKFYVYVSINICFALW